MRLTESTLSKIDEAILVGIQRGDEAVYKTLFTEYYPVLTTFALKYVSEIDTAKEVVQEVFIKLYRKRESLTIQQSLKAYLFKAVYRTCLNVIDQENRRSRHYQEATLHQSDTEYTDCLEEAEATQRIYRAIEQLPEQCQRIFTMNRFEGLSNQAIADQLNISKRTVETQISKALKLLRKALFLLTVYFLLGSNFF
ncbi:MAG: RNA polymerase sigma-70 factor [Cyclobacteriaceae bacterium]